MNWKVSDGSHLDEVFATKQEALEQLACRLSIFELALWDCYKVKKTTWKKVMREGSFSFNPVYKNLETGEYEVYEEQTFVATVEPTDEPIMDCWEAMVLMA